MSLRTGHLLQNRYRIVDVLGQGGMGAVYRAIDENLDVTVAVKENSFRSDEYARQFQREAKVLASLRHPNLPRVFDYFVIDQQGQYLVMDYIEGEDLRQWMSRENYISESEALQIGIAICDALIYLHACNPAITHRDIKPGNIKISPGGQVLLVDFGLVKVMGEKEMTTTAARAMTPGYSPPEQYGETSTDQRSDIYSLGATLYAALTGYLPEDGLSRITGKAELTPLKNYQPQITTETAKVIEKAIAIKFEDRWQSAYTFKQALIAAREGLPLSTRSSERLTQAPVENNLTEKYLSPDDQARNPLRKILKRLTEDRADHDPVWVVYGGIILFIIVMLVIYMLWPSAFQGFVIGSGQFTPTNTGFKRIFATTTVTSPVIKTMTTTPILPSPTQAQAPSLPSTPIPVIAEPTDVLIYPTALGGGAGKLAFVSERTGIPQIWLMDVEIGRAHQLTRLNDGACQPDWSPAGDRIVFTSPCPGVRSSYPQSALHIIDILDGKIQPLPPSLEGDFDPAWSPDGNWIVYTSLINGQMQLMKISLDDLTIVRLSDGTHQDSSPAWSPDGKRLAFVRLRGVQQIWLMDVAGENLIQFTFSGEVSNSNPAWYPDEKMILFSQELGPGSPSKHLFGMRIENAGESEEVLINPKRPFEYIALMDNVDVSPDGYWLAFEYWYSDVLPDIYMMTFSGAKLRKLTNHPAKDYDPVWQPSGQVFGD